MNGSSIKAGVAHANNTGKVKIEMTLERGRAEIYLTPGQAAAFVAEISKALAMCDEMKENYINLLVRDLKFARE